MTEALDTTQTSIMGAAVDQQDSQMTAAPGLDGCKLVILGLPWDTDEQTLQTYFSQYGPLEEATIMKDRHTGKSRGFGFVSFKYAADASRVLTTEHQIDGRRCEAKPALPRGGGSNSSRTTRIFVARILPTVNDEAFKAHFEQYGTVQDAYMPKDASKVGHRGIGFVTFANADSVEAVLAAAPHILQGQELAIDQATPKDKGAAANLANGFAAGNGAQALYGGGLGGSGLTNTAAFSINNTQHQLAMLAARGSLDPSSLAAFASMNAVGGSMQGMMAPMHDLGMGSPGSRIRGQPGMSGGAAPSGLDAQAGPRIFVGKLNRATTEADVREYFARFGFVLDVYMPRDKHNRNEHRGFGFVTFETEASVQRVGAHGIHHIRGVAVAIDSAAPRKDEGAGQLAGQMPLGQLAAQMGPPQGAGQAAVGQVPSQPPPPGQMAPGQMNPGHMVSGPMAPGQMVGAPPPGHGYANTGDGSYPGLAAAMHVIDLAARGDAGPLRHVHAAGSAQGRYRPYAPQGADMGPAPGGGY